MDEEVQNIIEDIALKDRRYKEDAYEFVLEALSYSQKKFRAVKHVTSDQLLEGIRELLMKKFGPLTLSVLEYWGVRSTEDFGHIVFNLVENRALCKTDGDNLESFRRGYDFKEVFHEGYRKQLARKISRMRGM